MSSSSQLSHVYGRRTYTAELSSLRVIEADPETVVRALRLRKPG